MTLERRGVTNLRTMAGLVDGRRKRTSYGALLELSMLEMERLRLAGEITRANLRSADINKRIAEIDTKKIKLLAFVERSPESSAPVIAADIFPNFILPTGAVKSRRLSY
jgi:hypothetical protein